jgi:hypothetical protein
LLCSTVSNPEGDNFQVRQWICRVFNSTDPSLSAAETVKYCCSNSSSKFYSAVPFRSIWSTRVWSKVLHRSATGSTPR